MIKQFFPKATVPMYRGFNHTVILACCLLSSPITNELHAQAIPELLPAEEVQTTDEAEDNQSLRDDVLEWIDELDAPQLAQRREAEQKLIEAGPDVLLFLPEGNARLSAEAAERLSRVRSVLEQSRTQTELAEVKIYLDKVTTLEEALEAISRDSGVEFEYAGNKTIPIESIPTPLKFWNAVDLVLDQAKLDINFYGGDRETFLLNQRAEDRPDRADSAAYTGVYRIEPTSITARRSSREPSLSRMNISLEIAWEPRVTPIGLTIPVDQISALLDDGATLQPQSSSDTIDVAANNDIAFSEFYLPMELPIGRPRKIERLSGVIKAMLPGKRQRFKLDLAGQTMTQSIDAMTVTIEQVRRNGPLHEVRVGITLKNADRSLESHRQWIFGNEAFVMAADGSRLDHLGYEVYRESESGVGIGYLFDVGDSPEGMQLIYVSPTSIIQNEVQFLLQDIRLP